MGVAETPHLGMEHQTINAYGNNYKQYPSGFDEIFQHELGHEWFGNQMSAGNWDDYWLHEGFAQYMQPLYGRWREGEARYAVMMDEFRLQITN
ncbi:M1 family metallopeptidase, partial [Escherichia coli]|nr:M1 family metallopeptidase [Escherichia coli]